MISVREYLATDLDEVLAITERAWEPVFPKMREDIQDYVYDAFYPDGWRTRQRADVTATCLDEETAMWVAESTGTLAGYMGLREHPEDSMGEISIIAVDPRFQRQGVGSALMAFAFEWMRQRKLKIALVETGDDRGHAPARASYERAGFSRYPVARYFKAL